MTVGIFEYGSKIGFSNNIGTGNFVLLSNATVVNPTGEQARVVSTSASDALAGTGIQKVKITYFDNTWKQKSEIVTLNGLTPVLTTATNIFRIESFEAFQMGTNPFGAVGTINLQSTDATRLFAQIDSDNTIFTRALHLTSPGKQTEIIDIILSCATSAGVVFLLFISKDNIAGGGNIVPIPDVTYILASNSFQASFEIPILISAATSTQGLRVGIAVKGLATSQIASATFHFRDRQIV